MKLFAIYSALQSRHTGEGEVEYQTPDGGSVIVTEVSSDPEFQHASWSDKKLLGEVTEYVRRISHGTHQARGMSK